MSEEMNANAERVTITTEMLNKIFGVLGNMPYAQVAALFQEIQQDVRPLVSEAPEPKKEVS